MKTIISSLFVIILVIPLFSQNIIDPPKLPHNFNDPGIYDRNFDKNNFLLGWNWGQEGEKLDRSMMINGYHDFPFNNNNVKDSTLIIPNTWVHDIISPSDTIKYYIAGSHDGDVVLNAHCLQLEPTLTVDSTQKKRRSQATSKRRN